jgi:adenine phosphoribosyltransferase
LPGEIKVQSSTGYSRSDLFINGVGKGDRVTLVDDILSTGGTLTALVSALKHCGAEVGSVLVVFDKSSDKGNIERSIGMGIKSMLRIGIENGSPVCL